jgi:hypothetical protein
VQPLGGAGEALLPSNFKKCVEPVEVHRYLLEAALSAATSYLNRNKMFCSFCPSRGLQVPILYNFAGDSPGEYGVQGRSKEKT